MKRKDAARKEGTCPRDAPKDEKCASCRSKKGACLVAARIAAGNALTSPDEASTSKPRTTQPVADSDMDIEPPNTRPSRERKAPERIEVDDLRSFATGKRRSAHSCCPSHMDAEPSTSEPAPKPKFTGPMDKYLSDKRVEAAVNRAVKSITDNPKKGGGAIYQRHIHYVKASEIEVTRRDLVHAEYSLKKSDCYRQICDIGEPGVVVCRHRSCHQCRQARSRGRSWRRLHRPRLCMLQGRGALQGSPGACLDGRPVRAR